MAKKLTIITHPHPTLRKKAETLDLHDIPKLKGFIDDMKKTMHEANGIGLAAPQVDVSRRIVVISTKDGDIALINPEISKKSFKKEEGEEGCLSIPGVFGLVKRHYSITVQAYTEQAKKIKFTASGLFARVIQHEVDHINGILFIDRTKKIMTGDNTDVTQNI
ncbi:MAG: peptide deformylase [Patescibacteria group bacterium]